MHCPARQTPGALSKERDRDREHLVLLLGSIDLLGSSRSASSSSSRHSRARRSGSGVEQRNQKQRSKSREDVNDGNDLRVVVTQQVEAVLTNDPSGALQLDRGREGSGDQQATEAAVQTPEPHEQETKDIGNGRQGVLQHLGVERALRRCESKEEVARNERRQNEHEADEAAVAQRAERVHREWNAGNALEQRRITQRRSAQQPEEVQRRQCRCPRLQVIKQQTSPSNNKREIGLEMIIRSDQQQQQQQQNGGAKKIHKLATYETNKRLACHALVAVGECQEQDGSGEQHIERRLIDVFGRSSALVEVRLHHRQRLLGILLHQRTLDLLER
jgi:hypothetical protein